MNSSHFALTPSVTGNALWAIGEIFTVPGYGDDDYAFPIDNL